MSKKIAVPWGIWTFEQAVGGGEGDFRVHPDRSGSGGSGWQAKIAVGRRDWLREQMWGGGGERSSMRTSERSEWGVRENRQRAARKAARAVVWRRERNDYHSFNDRL